MSIKPCCKRSISTARRPVIVTTSRTTHADFFDLDIRRGASKSGERLDRHDIFGWAVKRERVRWELLWYALVQRARRLI